MKKILSVLFILAIIIVFKQTAAAENTRVFYNSQEYSKIINNKSHIVKVVHESYPEGGYEKEECNIEKAYNMVEAMKTVKKSDIAICDADSCYIFVFDDGSSVIIRFEGKFLHYKGQNYEIIKK